MTILLLIRSDAQVERYTFDGDVPIERFLSRLRSSPVRFAFILVPGQELVEFPVQ